MACGEVRMLGVYAERCDDVRVANERRTAHVVAAVAECG
jgi:hypothetical protein